jgi:hypothetical protein
MCDDTWTKLFPLIPKSHAMRDHFRRVRALSVMWGTLPAYAPQKTSLSGAWMPLSEAHRVRLLKSCGLFDEAYHIPSNPWLAHEGRGISKVYNQSYHSVYYTDSYKAPHFRDWVKKALPYRPPVIDKSQTPYFPFSQYGGSPVVADFAHHCVEAPASMSATRHAELVNNRFGFTGALRLGQQFDDTGLLQDLYQFEYRPHTRLSRDQRNMAPAQAVYPSNFMAYARTHSIVALASCNPGTEEASVPRIVRNLFRLYVDTYRCMGGGSEDGVPVVLGFEAQSVTKKDDRPVVLYAGTLACINSKLSRFCNSGANRGERVCQLYKQVYLNDATLLYSRLLRSERRRIAHTENFRRTLLRRQNGYDRAQFDGELIDLQDAYIEFLQTTILGIMVENGADMSKLPLHLLETRDLTVSEHAEDTDVVGNDYLDPRTHEIIKDIDFGSENITRTQMAILSLIPPNHRVLGTLRLNQKTEIVDLEHMKKQIQKDTIASNKRVWDKYMQALVDGDLAVRLLEKEGPIDFGFDMSSIRDPLVESEGIRNRMTTTNSQQTSVISQSLHGENLRRRTGPDSVLAMNTHDMQRVLQAVRERVERDFTRRGGAQTRVMCLERLDKVPPYIKRIVRAEIDQ